MNRNTNLSLKVISLAILFTSNVCAQATQDLTGPYLGQPAPGDSAGLFAEGIIDPDLHSGPVFSADGTEAFWAPMESSEHIMTARLTGNGWSDPEPIACASSLPNSSEPCLSPDGTRLFFICQEDRAHDYKSNIWVAEREGTGWGVPQPVSSRINAMHLHWQFSLADNGDLYFSARDSGNDDIYVSAFADGEYQSPVALGQAINSNIIDDCPFIAPDGSYLLFTRSDHTSLSAELFISFRASDGSWTEARSMDTLNRDGLHDMCATVTRDGQYLLFLRTTSKGLSAHWVSARVIDEYR